VVKMILARICIFFPLFAGVAYAQLPESVSGLGVLGQAPGLPQFNGSQIPSQRLTTQQAAAARNLSPAQQNAIQTELARSGGALTPEAVEALKARPEFKGLSPDEILKGKERLEKKEADKKPSGAPQEKRALGEKEDRSIFDRLRTVNAYQDISTDLKPFGYDFFQDASIRILTERKDIPVPNEYIIGPGDEVKILLWGRVNAQHNLIVDRNGNITIPQIGPLQVAGMSFEQMSQQLIQQANQIVGANIDVTMGSLKSIPIFVLGDVRRPGAYTVGSFATITEALLIAGGPSGIGTMRNIQLKRKDKVITTFDLYDLFLKGDKSKDLILQAGDVVFVPVAGPIVGVAGNVKRPAIYELRDKFDLGTLFSLSGGIMPTAYTQQIQIERIVKAEKQIVLDINDKELTRVQHTMLQDADMVKIFNIVEKEANVVFLYGNVKRPGKYEYKRGMVIKDLLKDQTELLPETYFEYALIKRLEPPSFATNLIPLNLGQLFSADDRPYNMELRPLDTLYVFSRWFFRDRPYVTVEGEVRGAALGTPGEAKKIDIMGGDKGKLEDSRKLGTTADERKAGEAKTIGADTDQMKLSELRKLGLIDISDKKLEDLKRSGVANLDEMRLVDLRRQGLLGLLGIDESRIYAKKTSIEIPFEANMTVKDAILSAGGLTRDAYIHEAELYRIDEVTKKVTVQKFSLKKAFDGDKEDDIKLKDYDRIVVHSIWGYAYNKTVSIDGEVFKPGVYQYAENMTVKDLIFSAGNVLDSAYMEDADVSLQVVENGRVAKLDYRTINLKKALEGDPEHNLALRPYSRVFVKRITDWRREQFINLVGEVNFPGRYIFRKGETLSSLLERAGGYTDKAYLRAAAFTRTKVKDLQQKALAETVARLEKEMMAESASRASTALSAEEIGGLKAQQEGTRALIESLKKTEATGRVIIRLAHLRLLKGSEFDVELEDGDSLYIPTKNNVVSVSGAIMSQGTYVYSEALTYKDYIERAGSFSRYADSKNIFVLKVDGSAMRVPGGFINWSSSNSRWHVGAFGEEPKTIEPGDTIVVPEKIQTVAWLRTLRDVTQILSQVGIFAASMNFILK
jgi:polysaccharide biosynthesis/export protein